MSNTESSVNKYSCPSCNGKVAFNPQQGCLVCEYCGWKEISTNNPQEVEEKDYEEYLDINQVELAILSVKAVEVDCSSCGANIIFEPPRIAGDCPFCAAKIVNQAKQANPTIAPQGIIPFKIDRKLAREKFQQWAGNGLDFPQEVKKLAQLEKFQGVYLPYWTFDAQVVGYYEGRRVVEGEDSQKFKLISGTVALDIDDFLVSGTDLINSLALKNIEPWNIAESLHSYKPDYLAGFEATRSQLTLVTAFEVARKAINRQLYDAVCEDIGGSKQVVKNIAKDYSGIKFRYILLPVWLTTYHYRDRQYQVIINGHTGKVHGDRPTSLWTILVVLTALVEFCLIAVFLNLTNFWHIIGVAIAGFVVASVLAVILHHYINQEKLVNIKTH